MLVYRQWEHPMRTHSNFLRTTDASGQIRADFTQSERFLGGSIYPRGGGRTRAQLYIVAPQICSRQN